MKQQFVARLGIKRGLLATLRALGVGLSAGSAIAAEGLNQHADEILQSMSKFLAGTKAFSVTADISNEFITTEAQTLQLNSHATVLMERPSRFQVTRKGWFADVALFFDGSKLTRLVQSDFRPGTGSFGCPGWGLHAFPPSRRNRAGR